MTFIMFLNKVLPLLVLAILWGLNSAGAQTLVCPTVRTTSGWLDLFPLPCRKHAECRVMGTQHLCCKGYCTKGVTPPTAAPIRSETDQPSVESRASTSTSSSSSTSTTTSSTTTTTTPKPTTSTTTTTTTQRPTTEPPRPFLQILPIQSLQTTQVQKKQASVAAKTSKTQKFICPKPGSAPVLLFALPCENNNQCRVTLGPDQVCCENRCVKGVPAPRPTSKPRTHQPLLGVIPRECPAAPLGELLFEVQTCKTDADCWPRVCCPDGARSYCRTARARLDLVPIASQINGPVRMFEQYLQCTAPPRPDLFPQKCTSSVDCFPNLCCAEGGKKHCRPPQRSLIALLAGVTQRVGSTIGTLRQMQAANNRV